MIYRDGDTADDENRNAANDIRTMATKFIANGERKKRFKETIDEFTRSRWKAFPMSLGHACHIRKPLESVAEYILWATLDLEAAKPIPC